MIRPPSNSITAGFTFIVACEIIDRGGIGHNQPSGSAAGLCRSCGRSREWREPQHLKCSVWPHRFSGALSLGGLM